MRLYSKILVVLLALLFTGAISAAAQIPAPILSGLQSGDAKALAAHFYENIELVVLDRDLVCSQAQGEQILKEFFDQHRPKDFKLSHQGGNGSSYAIGRMETQNGNFRIYFLLKSAGGKSQIVQLRIDKD